MLAKKKLLYILYLFIVVIIGLELIARFYLGNVLQKSSKKKFRFNSYRIYEHVPGFTEGNSDGDWIVINDQGFRRTTNVEKSKPKKTYRIFLMGGSAAHGISSGPPYPIRHIYPDQTIDYYLEGLLNESIDSIEFEVINAAVTGYQVFQHTEFLMSELLDYDPDLVIFFDGANDHYANNPDFNYYLDNRYQFWKKRLQQPSITGAFDYTAYLMADYSALFRGYFAWRLQRDALKNNANIDLNTSYNSNSERLKGHDKISKKSFLRSIRTNVQILNAEKINSMLCLQPMLVLRKTDLLSSEETSFLHEDKNVIELYQEVVKKMDSLALSLNTDYIDFVPLFNDSSYAKDQLFIDYCHLTPLGGKVIADSLAKSIIKNKFTNQD